MTCELCKEKGKTLNGDNLKCAFENKKFNINNWNCATMNKLRDIAGEFGNDYGNYYTRNDDDAGSIGVIKLPDLDDGSGYLIMTWYKSRGAVGNAFIVWDDEKNRPLTLEIAEKIIEYYEDVM